MKKVCILGSGAFGTSMAILLSHNNMKVDIWTPFNQEALSLNKTKKHECLKGGVLNENIYVTTNLNDAVKGSEIIVIATPSAHVRETAHKLKRVICDQIIVCLSKGIEKDTLFRMSQIISDEIANSTVVTLSGPSHAEELALLMPTTCEMAHPDLSIVDTVKQIFECNHLKIFSNVDQIGVELGGALKNVIALSFGIIDGIGLGDNVKAALATLGMIEICKIGMAMGARESTFMGLSGIGDVIVTCTSVHSRNLRAGKLISQGKKVSEVEKEIGAVVEGIDVTRAAYDLGQKYNVRTPIIDEIYKVVFEHRSVTSALDYLMRL